MKNSKQPILPPLWSLVIAIAVGFACTNNSSTASGPVTLVTATATSNYQRLSGGTATVKTSSGQVLRTVSLDGHGFFVAGVTPLRDPDAWLVVEVKTPQGHQLQHCLKPSELNDYHLVNEFTSTACDELFKGSSVDDARKAARAIHGLHAGASLERAGSYGDPHTLRAEGKKAYSEILTSFAGSVGGSVAENMGVALATAGFSAVLDATGLGALSGLLGLGGDGVGQALEEIFEKLEQISNQLYEVQRELGVQHHMLDALTALVNVKANEEKALSAANGCTQQANSLKGFVNKVSLALNNYFVLSRVDPGKLSKSELEAHFWKNIDFLQEMREFTDPNNPDISLLTRDVRILYLKCQYSYFANSSDAGLITSKLYEHSASLVAYYTQLQYLAMVFQTLGEAAGKEGEPAKPLDRVKQYLEPNETALAKKLHGQLFIPKGDSGETVAVLKSRVPDGAFVDTRHSRIWVPVPPAPEEWAAISSEVYLEGSAAPEEVFEKSRSGWGWYRDQMLGWANTWLPLKPSELHGNVIGSLNTLRCVPQPPAPKVAD